MPFSQRLIASNPSRTGTKPTATVRDQTDPKSGKHSTAATRASASALEGQLSAGHAGACRPARVRLVHTDNISLHPSDQHPARRRPATVSLCFSEPRVPSRAPSAPVADVAPVVEVNGIEPMTSCLQSRRSPN